MDFTSVIKSIYVFKKYRIDPNKDVETLLKTSRDENDISTNVLGDKNHINTDYFLNQSERTKKELVKALDLKKAKTKEGPKYMIMQNDYSKQKWDIVIIICAIFNCVTIPIEIAFAPPFIVSKPMKVLNLCIDILFFVDICVNFRTGYIDETGHEIIMPA